MSKARALFFRSLCSLQSVGRPRLTTLIYHQVLPAPDPLRPWEVDRDRFQQQMSWINEIYKVIPLSEALQLLENNALDSGCACITFDDGYRNNATIAADILKQFGFHATFFCTTAYSDGDMMWNDKVIEAVRAWPAAALELEELAIDRLPVTSNEDKRNAIHTILNKLKYTVFNQRKTIADTLLSQSGAKPARQMMSTAEIAQLSRDGMEIGGHTHEHPILLNLDITQARAQIVENKKTLEAITDEPVKLFAFPNGKPGVDFSAEHIELLKEVGYHAAVTTSPGTARYSSDFFQLPRFTPWDRTAFRFLSRLALNYHTQPNRV